MDNKDGIIIIGAGGHSKVVLSTLQAAGKMVLGFVDDNPTLHGTTLLGYPILGGLSLLSNQMAILAIGNNQLRQRFAVEYAHLHWVSAIHPHSYVHESVKIGKGTVIFAGTVIQPNTIIGDHVIINTSTSIDHDCQIHDYAHIAPGSHLAGNVTIKDGSFLGVGTNVIPNTTIGEWSILGAGSTVVNTIPSRVKAKGLPATVYQKIESIIA